MDKFQATAFPYLRFVLPGGKSLYAEVILPTILEMWYIQKYLKLPIDPHGTSWVKVDISRTGGR